MGCGSHTKVSQKANPPMPPWRREKSSAIQNFINLSGPLQSQNMKQVILIQVKDQELRLPPAPGGINQSLQQLFLEHSLLTKPLNEQQLATAQLDSRMACSCPVMTPKDEAVAHNPNFQQLTV